VFAPTTGEQASSALMGMKNKRFVAYSEMKKDAVLNSTQVKRLTGGDKINARQLYGEVEEFFLYAMQCGQCQDPPPFDEIDGAVIRRTRLIPMETEFVEEPTKPFHKKVEDINVKELHHSFFQLLLEHYTTDIKKGIEYCPLKIQEQTEKYFQKTNGILQFCDEFLVREDGSFCTKTQLKELLTDRQNIKEYSFGGMKQEQLMEAIADAQNVVYYKQKKINGTKHRNVLMNCRIK
jgi:phage/plasmid-associated DNA primase